jgi:hypothetical protein
MTILEEADAITKGDRFKDYGHPALNHGITAGLWNVYQAGMRGRQFDARDVCWFNILQKCARDLHHRKRDNLVDTAGFARNAEMVEEFRPGDNPTKGPLT